MTAWSRLFLVFCVAASFLVSADLEAAKKKKAEPVTIIKASDTQYKHAKLVRTKKVKKKFLWFKKRKPEKTIAPVQSRLNVQPMVPTVVSPAVVEPSSELLDTTGNGPLKGSDRELIRAAEEIEGSEEAERLLPSDAEADAAKPVQQ